MRGRYWELAFNQERFSSARSREADGDKSQHAVPALGKLRQGFCEFPVSLATQEVTGQYEVEY